MSRLLWLVIGSFLLLTLLGMFFALQTGFFTTRATITPTAFSEDNSYIFATPLQVAADGVQKIRITVFVLNSQGLGVLGRAVDLGQNPKLLVDSVQSTTDNLGKALFDVSTKSAGQYYIQVKVDGILLPQTVQITVN